MLVSFQNKLNKLAGIDLTAIFIRVMSNPGIQQQIIDWNQYQMEEQGIDSDGASLGEYAASTIQYKIKMGQPYDHITLKDTGDFYNSIRVSIENGIVKVVGDTQKPDKDLKDQWPDMLGLTKESIEQIRPMFNELFISEYKKEVKAIMYGKAA